MGRLFGTDGVRGVANQDLSAELAMAVSGAAARHLATVGGHARRSVAIVGAPTENSDGCVWIAKGSAAGPVLSGSVNVCGKSAGITVHGVKGYFGAALPSTHVEL